MRTVLIITDRAEEYYYLPFVRANETMGYPVEIVLFFWAEYPRDQTFSAYLDSAGYLSGFIDVIVARTGEKRKIDLRSIDVAWHLRPHSMKKRDREMSDAEFAFLHSEARSAPISLFSCMDCAWINSRQSVAAVDKNKLYQQRAAAMCGLTVPSTLISSVPDDITGFESETTHLLLKPIGHVDMRKEDGTPFFIYAQRLPKTLLINHCDQLTNAPSYVQRYIEKRFEYRIMVIGREVISCRMSSQETEKTSVDWRHYDLDNTPHEDIPVPGEVAVKLLDFMSQINLRYGAIDMIETPGGDFVFLEVNPSGQWDWINNLAGLDIPGAVGRMLVQA